MPEALKQPREEDDCSLLERIGGREEQAISLLYDRYSTVIYSMAFRILRDPVLAETVLSDVFMEIWRSPSRYMDAGANLSFFLLMIARNRSVAMLRHEPTPDFDSRVPYRVANTLNSNMTLEEASSKVDRMVVERRTLMENLLFKGSPKTTLGVPMKNSLEQNESVKSTAVSKLADSGLEVIDLESDPEFARRKLHVRDAVMHLQGMNRIARIFAENSTAILQQLVTAAIELCGADSAGVSVVQADSTDDDFYRWVATAGQYSGFLNAKLPRYPSACGVTLERECPQIFRVSQKFFDRMGVQAPIVTDGLLLPWRVEETRGTIWIMAHGRTRAFDREDCRVMRVLAEFAATGVRLQQHQELLIEQARKAGEAAMANSLAHDINNPLQGLTQTVYLFGQETMESSIFAEQAMGELMRLSNLVKRHLSSHE